MGFRICGRFHKDSGERISEEEWRKAVECIRKALDEKSIRELRRVVKEDEMWWARCHHGFGTGIRNLLRANGFDWGDISLDEHWFLLVEEAVESAE